MSKPVILFICTHNSARSQMAEALLRHIYGEKYDVYSAGTNPTNVNPLAIKVLAELRNRRVKTVLQRFRRV